MALLLVVAPKSALVNVEEQQENVLSCLTRNAHLFLGPRYVDSPVIHTQLNGSGAWVVQWHSKNGQDDDCFAIRRGKWAASSSNKTAQSLVDNLTSRAGSVRFDVPVWGSFAAVHGDKGSSRLLAWNTVPAVDPIYFGEDQGNFYISNRPVICKLAMAQRDLDAADLDLNYLVEYFEFGYSFSGMTPFSGVRSLPSRTALSIYGASHSFIAAPYQHHSPLAEKDDNRATGASELAEALIRAAERCVDRSPYEELQIRLSGGLDSRLLLGLFRQQTVGSILCVTHGVRTDAEVAIASELTELAGVEHVVKAPEPLVANDYLASLEKSIVDSGGLIPSESLVAPHSPTKPFAGGGAIALGQWPLFKGYLDRVPSNSEEQVALQIATRAAGLVNEEYSQYCFVEVEKWMSSMGAVSNVEVLYNFARDQRSSRYLEAQTSQIDRDCHVSYPMVDSEVTWVSDSIPLYNRALNYASFLALQKIWPESLSVPLNTTQTLRFEAKGPEAGISGDSFAERRREPRTFNGTVETPSYAGTTFEQMSLAVEYYTADFIKMSATWPSLKSMLDDETLGLIDRVISAGPMRSGGLFESYGEKKNARMALSRLALGAMWLSGEWMRPLG